MARNFLDADAKLRPFLSRGDDYYDCCWPEPRKVRRPEQAELAGRRLARRPQRRRREAANSISFTCLARLAGQNKLAPLSKTAAERAKVDAQFAQTSEPLSQPAVACKRSSKQTDGPTDEQTSERMDAERLSVARNQFVSAPEVLFCLLGAELRANKCVCR